MGRKARMDVYRLIPSTTEEHEVSIFTQRVNAAVKTATNLGPCLLFAQRTEAGMRDYIAIRSSSQSASAAMTFAEAVSSEAVPVSDKSGESPEQLDEIAQLVKDSEISHAHIDDDSIGSGRYSQANSSPLALSRIVPEQLEVGQWFAISVRQPTTGNKIQILRKLDPGEVVQWGIWFASKTEGSVTTHPSLETNSVVIELFSGNSGYGRHSKSESRRTLTEIVAAMPGFDAIISTKTLPKTSRWISMAILGIALFVAGFIVPELLPPIEGVEIFPKIVKAILLIAGGLAVADTVLRATRTRLPEHIRIRNKLMLMVPPTSKRRTRPRPPRREQMNPQTGRVMKRGHVGDYPLTPRSIKTAPSVFAAAFSPSAGVVSGET